MAPLRMASESALRYYWASESGALELMAWLTISEAPGRVELRHPPALISSLLRLGKKHLLEDPDRACS